MEAIVQLKVEQSGAVDGSHVIFTIYKLPSRPRTDQTLAPIGNILKLDDPSISQNGRRKTSLALVTNFFSTGPEKL